MKCHEKIISAFETHKSFKRVISPSSHGSQTAAIPFLELKNCFNEYYKKVICFIEVMKDFAILIICTSLKYIPWWCTDKITIYKTIIGPVVMHGS